MTDTVTPDPVEELPETVPADAAPEGEQVAEAPPEQGAEAADDLVVTIGDEPAPTQESENAAPAWLKDLRKSDREKTRRIRELEQRLQQAQPAPQAVVIGPKPSLQGCDYDEEKFAAEFEAWQDRRIKSELNRIESEKASEAQAAEWNKRLNGYQQQKMAIRVPNFDAAEDVVKDVLSVTQQSLLIKACKQPALMVAALGNNERKARELAALSDPVEFVAELVRTEAQLKTQARKPATLPEKSIPRSSMSGAAAVDNQLSKLQEQAARTGDRTPVVRYLQGKAKQAA